jgi:PAS domain S-box-containing protein
MRDRRLRVGLGPVGAVTGLVLDTTPQEIRLRGLEEKFQRAFQSNPNPMLITRLADGVIVDANDSFLAATGYAREEVAGRSTEDVVWPTPTDRERLLQRLKADGRVRGLEVLARTKDGGILDWLLSIEVIELDGAAHTIGTAVDITARKQVEADLQKSEAKFELAFRLNPNVMAITRLRDGVIVDVNDAWVAVTGYSREEAIGRTTLELVWQSGDERAAVVERLRADGRLSAMPVKTRTKGGEIRESLLSGEMMNLDGEVHVLIASKDVTEQTRVTAALRESEERFRELVEELDVGVSVLDANLRVILANPAAFKLLDVTAEELLGQVPHEAPFESVTEDGTVMTRDMQPSRIAMVTRQPVRHVVMGRRKVGQEEWRWYLVDAVPQLDDQGLVRRTIITFYDITARRQAEESQRQLHTALREALSDWTTTFDALETPALILAADGTIHRLNRAARDLAGAASYADLTHRQLVNVGVGEPWRTMGDLAREVLTGGVSARRQVQEAESRRSWYVTATPVKVGLERRVVAVARDVTDFVQLQESLRRTETMSALGAVVVGVAHEVRNPLFAISATVDAFDARFGGQPELGRYVGALRREVKRLSELMGALLDYARPPTLELGERDVRQVLRRAIEHCRPLTETLQVQVLLEAAHDLPRVRLDETRMLQVFQNLIDNAAQHSVPGGVVAVEAGVVVEGRGSHLDVTVADRGPGFQEEDIPHLFEPFFTRRHGGTGLGLSIVQRIVEQHGGQVLAGNRRGGGAMMTVRLEV